MIAFVFYFCLFASEKADSIASGFAVGSILAIPAIVLWAISMRRTIYAYRYSDKVIGLIDDSDVEKKTLLLEGKKLLKFIILCKLFAFIPLVQSVCNLVLKFKFYRNFQRTSSLFKKV
ncbi:hypothetical protein MHC_04800 [Mycoplasma haemocanis str. Illinois]|uniref:Uncharacterized protein n=1 Tax=Mycoplasma haemocanis (strain Illinois) TaxID=1111676 RepID=H6N844_MYCHN|nr:hypothetical protein [Mycoplasma haemocanis]AEW45816.1 hypothetical protein MHC_04800 [Mycoplasma haemocanis str. Illinois]